MLLLSAIDHIVLRVTSLDSMARFYCDVLGCIREREVRNWVLCNCGPVAV